MGRENLRQTIIFLYGEVVFRMFHRFDKLRQEKAKLLSSLTFLVRCRDAKVIPSFLKVKEHFKGPRFHRIYKRTSFALLRNIIHECRRNLDFNGRNLLEVHLRLASAVSPAIFDMLDKISSGHFYSTLRSCSERQASKFHRLDQRHEYPSLDSSRVVVNLSDKVLSNDAQSVLVKGHDFAVSPKCVPVEEIIASVESAVRRLPSADAEEIRHGVAAVLKKSKPPLTNITKTEHCALKELKSDKDILVLRADKGNATVVMNSSDYKDRIAKILSSKEFKLIKSDPTRQVEKKTTALLKASSLDSTVIKKLTPKESIAPRLYGLPKIHKVDYPLRPIVSSIRSPTYDLSSHLALILQPHIGHTASFVRDSAHFVEIIRGIRLQPSDVLISFDVVSLFTKVPVQDVLRLIAEKFPPDITNLFRHCLTSCYFKFDNTFYEQIDGVAMGNSLSPAVANLYMEEFEKIALESAQKKPSCWLRYVDDTFVIWPHGMHELNIFLEHLNNQNQQIQFTMEIENNGSLPFLDVFVTRKTDGSLSRSVYRKPTQTNRYLHAKSHHHPAQKFAVISTLFHRAQRICDDSTLSSELRFLKECLSANGYSHGSINQVFRQKPKKTNVPEPQLNVYLPFIRGTTDRIGRILRKFNLKPVFSSKLKISNLLRSPKDPQDPFKNPGVYSIKCECDRFYIGETGRSVSSRVSEHERALRLHHPNKSALAFHCLEEGHRPNLKQPTLISISRFYFHRIIREAIEIKKCPNNVNLDNGNYNLPMSWSILFR